MQHGSKTKDFQADLGPDAYTNKTKATWGIAIHVNSTEGAIYYPT